jgi:hypothetical protein
MVESFKDVAQAQPSFKCKLEELRLSHPEKPSLEVLARAVGVTPLTLMKIRDGGDVKLSNAWKIAKIFGLTPNDIWEPV